MALTRTQRLKEKKKYYTPVTKTSVICESCHDSISTSRRNQTHCQKDKCQRARKLKNMNNYCIERVKKLEEK